MTGIAWRILKDQIWLVADTMLSNDKHQCGGETGKILPILHADAMICIIGSPYAIADWMQFLISAEVVGSLAELNASASVFLRYLYPQRYQKHPINECRLYQFGLNDDGEMAGYLLEQPDFTPTKLALTGSDPSIKDFPMIPNTEALKGVLIHLSKEFPNYIGCSIHYANLRKGQITLKLCHEFGDKQGLLKDARSRMIETTDATIESNVKTHEHFNRTGLSIRDLSH
jgi:hypothetical protein